VAPVGLIGEISATAAIEAFDEKFGLTLRAAAGRGRQGPLASPAKDGRRLAHGRH
jgi:hypothetical protein